MVNWSLLQNATSPDNKPTPGWLFHEICLDVRNSPKDCPDVAEYLMQCVCSDHLNIQLKAVLVVKHLAAEDITFQQYLGNCAGALKILEDIAAPPIVPQARSLESQEVKTVRDATRSALISIHTPHTVEKSTEAASLKQKILGFGNFEPPPEEVPPTNDGVAGQVAEFVGDSIGDMVDDFREKGAVGALKDATIDALDLVLDGVDAVWSWMAGKSEDNAPRICQPTNQVPGFCGGAAMVAGPTGANNMTLAGLPSGTYVTPPAALPLSVPNHYAAAFGHGVVGANNPVLLSGPSIGPCATISPSNTVPGAGGTITRTTDLSSREKQTPTPLVDLMSMDEPNEQLSHQSAPTIPDLLGDMTAPSPSHTTQNMIDF